jgi:hypothetical protein
MPCEKNSQVDGTLLPQDKEGFGSFTSHEENVKFIFEGSRTLRSNQRINGEYSKNQKRTKTFKHKQKTPSSNTVRMMFL